MHVTHSKMDYIRVTKIDTKKRVFEIKKQALDSGFKVISIGMTGDGYQISMERKVEADTMPEKWLDSILTNYKKNT